MSQHTPSTEPRPRLRGADVSGPAARLRLAASAPTQSRVDGAWWPRSTDLVAELPALLDAVHDRTGPVALVGFHRSAWQRAESQVDIAGESIWLEGFTDEEPHTVIVFGSSGRRLTLMVVAPNTAHDAALEGLVAGSRAGSATENGADAGNARTLDEVVARLAAMEEHTDERRTQTIERWVHEAAEQFTDAPVQAFVPILVEHIVRQKLTTNRQRSLAKN